MEAVKVGPESPVSSPGDDKYGRKLIVFSSCCLPPSHQLNHRRLLEYVVINRLIRGRACCHCRHRLSVSSAGI